MPEKNGISKDIVTSNPSVTVHPRIERLIYSVRGQQVMLDKDIAALYGVETRILNQAVKRNIDRFPENYRFQLSNSEKQEVITICDNPDAIRFSPSRPFAFTEQGVAMLSAVLHSKTAIAVSIEIMNAFVAMRRFLNDNALIFRRLDAVEHRQLVADHRINELFDRMEAKEIEPKQGIFFQGEIFDAYAFFENILREAEHEIVLIDNYIDLSILERLSKKKTGVKVTVYTSPKTPVSSIDIATFNSQYPTLTLNFTSSMHDRFIIIDGLELYHLGASLKDLGKKCFAFQKMENADIFIAEILKNL